MRIGTAVAVAAVAFVAGCTTFPVRVTDTYVVPAGQPVGLAAPAGKQAMVLGVEIDTSSINLGDRKSVGRERVCLRV
jgi:hypothetical protein